MMKASVKGQVAITKLRKGDYLLPLKEAVSNSLHATRKLGEGGKIDVYIRRKSDGLIEDGGYKDIVGFDVIDNGEGFTDANFESFNTLASTQKQPLGGKGIGRFTWLVAFESVDVDSRYLGNGGKVDHRAFTFSLRTDDGVEELEATLDDSADSPRTAVHLRGYRERYREMCPKKAETIAQELTMHFLSKLISEPCPCITVHCPDRGERIALIEDVLASNRFNLGDISNAEGTLDEQQFELAKERFSVTVLALGARLVDTPRMVWLANGQAVGQGDSLLYSLRDLPQRLSLKDGTGEVSVVALLSSNALDAAVDPLRGQFVLDHESANGQTRAFDTLTEESVRKKAVATLAGMLQPIIDSARETKERAVEAFFETPQGFAYRTISEVRNEVVNELPFGAQPDKIEEAFQTKFLEHCRSIRRLGQEILPKLSEEVTEDLKQQFDKFKAGVIESNLVKLAEYIAWRRAILDIATAIIARKDDGKFHYEQELHNLVFPMREKGEHTEYRGHNLWLIDERLALFAFVYSDVPLKEMDELGSESKERPDVIAVAGLDAAPEMLVFAEDESLPLANIALVEFKRATDAQSAAEKSNPLKQLVRYVKEIRAGEMRFTSGRLKGQKIVASEGARFWCYAICEINKDVRATADDLTLPVVEEGMRICGYHPIHRAYFDVMSFSCFIREAQIRNVAFFREAGLPTR